MQIKIKSAIFDRYLYDIQKIGINHEISIAMGGKISKEMLDDMRTHIPKYLTGGRVEITITKSPLDNVSDDLIADWECEAAQENYLPQENNVFKKLETFFEKVFQLNSTQAIWVRYEGTFDCEVYKLASWKNLEASSYPKYLENNYGIPDFEIYMDKQKT